MNDTSTTAPGADFAAEVEKASGARLLACLQCKKCTSGCPVAARVDLKPHEVVRLVQMGEREEVLASRTIWECTSCQTCTTRCPQRVDIAAMNDGLRRLSRAARLQHRKSAVPKFNDIFLGIVRRRGRMYEAGLMARFKLSTGRLFEDLSKLPMMLLKGKMPLLPPKKVADRGERRRMFERAASRSGDPR